jgi:hypothetical protein
MGQSLRKTTWTITPVFPSVAAIIFDDDQRYGMFSDSQIRAWSAPALREHLTVIRTFKCQAGQTPTWHLKGNGSRDEDRQLEARGENASNQKSIASVPNPSEWKVCKYPPAKPGALICEPLKAAVRGR